MKRSTVTKDKFHGPLSVQEMMWKYHLSLCVPDGQEMLHFLEIFHVSGQS